MIDHHSNTDIGNQLRALQARIDELEAARIGYAGSFPPNKDGHPDVGNIHANIRALQAQNDYLWETVDRLQQLLSENSPAVYWKREFDRMAAECKALKTQNNNKE